MTLRRQLAWARLEKNRVERGQIQAETARIRMDTCRIEAEMHRASIAWDATIEMLCRRREAEARDDTKEGT